MTRQQRRQDQAPRNWIRWLLALALLAGAAAPAFAASGGGQGDLPCAAVTQDAITGWPEALRDCDYGPGGGNNDVTAMAGAFLNDYGAQLGLVDGAAGLRLISTRHGLASSHLIFQQHLGDYPVYGAYLSFHFDGTGYIQVVHNRTQPGLLLQNGTPALSAVDAVRLAREAIRFAAPRASSPAPELVVLPVTGDPGRLVWRVMVAAAQPQGDWEVLVDAASGAVIKRYNRLVLARGQVFGAAGDDQNSPPAGDLPPLRTLTLQGLDESGWLRGEYVDVTQPDGYRPATAFSASANFVYQPDDPRFKEVMVYYHIDAAQRYIQSLGYSDRNSPPNGIRERVTFASPHWFAQDQSFYSVSDDALHFGDGGWPDALDPDIIVHEYGHALLHDLAPHWGGGEMEAIGEGFGDYLAASRFAESSPDPACIGELDSRGYAGGAAQCLRRVDRDRQYPVDVSGDPHADGEIWSRVLWDVRAAAGREAADVLALESNFYLPPTATLVEAGQALLDADASVYDGRYRQVIEQALRARGLAPLPAPQLLTPTGGQLLTPGNLLAVDWETTAVVAPDGFDLQWSSNVDAVGVARHDFERSLPADFTTHGSAPWQVIEGAARSGKVTHGQTSSLVLPVQTMADGRLSFRYRVDSEQGYDLFEFLVDGQVMVRASGPVSWRTFEVDLAAGQHELVWRYSKDGTVSRGRDAAWVDAIVVEHTSLALWRPAELAPGRSANGAVLWRVPSAASPTAALRLRTRTGDVASPWVVRADLTIDAPTAVSLVGLEAGAEQMLGIRLPVWPWGAAGLLCSLAGGVAVGLLATRRRRGATPV